MDLQDLPDRVRAIFLAGRGKMRQNEGKSFLQGLKPVESTQFTSALKHRPPEEKTLSAAC
jgi:hypothetical protein